MEIYRARTSPRPGPTPLCSHLMTVTANAAARAPAGALSPDGCASGWRWGRERQARAGPWGPAPFVTPWPLPARTPRHKPVNFQLDLLHSHGDRMQMCPELQATCSTPFPVPSTPAPTGSPLPSPVCAWLRTQGQTESLTSNVTRFVKLGGLGKPVPCWPPEHHARQPSLLELPALEMGKLRLCRVRCMPAGATRLARDAAQVLSIHVPDMPAVMGRSSLRSPEPGNGKHPHL